MFVEKPNKRIIKQITPLYMEIKGWWHPIGNKDGGSDMSLVEADNFGKPSCKKHGAMNKVSPDGLWRCLFTGCRAGCKVN